MESSSSSTARGSEDYIAQMRALFIAPVLTSRDLTKAGIYGYIQAFRKFAVSNPRARLVDGIEAAAWTFLTNCNLTLKSVCHATVQNDELARLLSAIYGPKEQVQVIAMMQDIVMPFTATLVNLEMSWAHVLKWTDLLLLFTEANKPTVKICKTMFVRGISPAGLKERMETVQHHSGMTLEKMFTSLIEVTNELLLAQEVLEI
jgi:hypothetical protein